MGRRGRLSAIMGLAILAGLAETGPARALDPCVPANRETVSVAEVVSGNELRLADGRLIRLAATAVPPGTAPDPSDETRLASAKEALQKLAAGDLSLAVAAKASDRHGRLAGHLVAADGRWIEAAMVAAGHLRVTPGPDDRRCARALLAIEATARAGGLGLWADTRFAVIPATDPARLEASGSYAIVEGRVVSVGASGRRRYIDFGRSFRDDFTIIVEDRDVAGLERAGFVLERMRGKSIRVRGWLDRNAGGQISVRYPEELEWAD